MTEFQTRTHDFVAFSRHVDRTFAIGRYGNAGWLLFWVGLLGVLTATPAWLINPASNAFAAFGITVGQLAGWSAPMLAVGALLLWAEDRLLRAHLDELQ